MKKTVKAALEMSTLTVYRNLLRQPLIAAYQKLLQEADRCSPDEPEAFLLSWTQFCQILLESGAEDDLLGYVTKEFLPTDDNHFARRSAAGKNPGDRLRYAADRDLDILLYALSITPQEILREAGAAETYGETLPVWNSGQAPDLLCSRDGRIERLIEYYRRNGCGIYVKHRAFIWRNRQIIPVEHPDPIRLDDLKGYRTQREAILSNTEAFLDGKPSNNCLLYGDRGTGKSSTVKAVMNEYFSKGLRVVEMPKESLMEFPFLVDQIADIPLHFLIFIDDLSFSHQDETYASLKAVLEGGVASRPENTLIYATSNRRHLLRETFSDREGDEVHRKDTIEESLSLADRFGLTVNFSHPAKQEYLDLVAALAEKQGIRSLSRQELDMRAEQWALLRGGRSPRCAVQFINQLLQEVREIQSCNIPVSDSGNMIK